MVALRIGLLTHSVNPRGGVVHALALGEALADAGHAVTVFAPAAPGQRFFRAPRCATALVPLAGAPAPADATRAMVQRRIDAYVAHLSGRIDRDDFDIWHAHDGIGGNALATLAELGRLPQGFVRTVHHLDRFDDALLMAWQRRSVRAAAQVLCVSRLWRRVLAEDEAIDALQVANGVDVRRFDPAPQAGDAAVAARLGLRVGGPLVLAVGGIEARKNTRRLLEAFALLRQQQPGAQLVVAGGVSLLDHADEAAAFHAAMAREGLSQGPGQPVLITGAVAEADMPALYRLADVLAMPSLREGFGLVVLEALASGTPVVAAQIEPFTEYLDDTLCAWADPLDSASIAAALSRALARGRSRERPAAVQALCERHDWGTSAARHVEIYRALLARSARPEPCHA